MEDVLEEETPEGGRPEDVLDPGQLEGVVWRVKGAVGRGKHPVHGHAGPKLGPRELQVGATRAWARHRTAGKCLVHERWRGTLRRG